jgi:cytochrome c-type biogenesis protein CcmH/NrfG
MAKKTYLTAKSYKKITDAKREKIVFEVKEKKEVKRIQFPSISRLIPESLKNLTRFQWWMVTLSSCLLIFLGMSLYFLGVTTTQYLSLLSQRQTFQAQQMYWQGVVKSHPDYRDGYMMLAALSYKLREKQQAQKAISKALELDPNNIDARALAEKIAEK